MSKEKERPTDRDKEILSAVVDKGSIAKAAEKVIASPETVKKHLAALRQEYGFTRTSQLTAYAKGKGWI